MSTSTSTSTTTMPTTLHFTKAVIETRTYNLTLDLTYKQFMETYVSRNDEETDKDYKERCDSVWIGMCARMKGKKNPHIALPDEEKDAGDFDDYDSGDEDELFGDDIEGFVEKEDREYTEWKELTPYCCDACGKRSQNIIINSDMVYLCDDCVRQQESGEE